MFPTRRGIFHIMPGEIVVQSLSAVLEGTVVSCFDFRSTMNEELHLTEERFLDSTDHSALLIAPSVA